MSKFSALFMGFIIIVNPLELSASPMVLKESLYNDSNWLPVETTKTGITISEKVVDNVAVKAVKVTQEVSLDPEILAQVIEDVANYGRFLTSASAMECELLAVDESGLVGYQYVDVPVISDRVYAFKMYRPDRSQTRVDWELIPESKLANYEVNERPGVYIDYGVGSWSMNKLENGLYEVSYRLVMDPGGWIPGNVSDYFNRVSIVGIFKDALIETQRRSLGGKL
ncbi:MAG: hypothetical protein HQ507_09860 [Candidatus Marinimicrobia bacterium]|nr:hypothetical protein [Candidatus Neomarinimicrobiota bacterium]